MERRLPNEDGGAPHALFAYQVPPDAEPYHSLALLLAAADTHAFDHNSLLEATAVVKEWHESLMEKSPAVHAFAQALLLIAAFALTRQARIGELSPEDELYRTAHELALYCLYRAKTPFIRLSACFLLHDIALHSAYHLPADFYKTRFWESALREIYQANVDPEWRTMMLPSLRRWKEIFVNTNPFGYGQEIMKYINLILRRLGGEKD